jgi:hypothetical protein
MKTTDANYTFEIFVSEIIKTKQFEVLHQIGFQLHPMHPNQTW